MSQKIDLEEIKTDKKYTTLAFFVDNPLFLKEVVKVRKILGIKELVKHEDVMSWVDPRKKRHKYSIIVGEDLEGLIREIKAKFNKGINFTEVIRYAILAGKVANKQFTKTAYCELYPFSQEFEDYEIDLEEPMVAILVNPETKPKEIRKLMETEVKKLFSEVERHDITPRASKNIRRDRDWYWMNKEGLGYGGIWKSLKKEDDDGVPIKGVPFDKDGVRQAIKKYKKNLAMYK